MDIEQVLKSIDHNAHYLSKYITFIKKCQHLNECYTGMMERHHICPKANDMFPQYKSFRENPWNLANLTPRQHFIAHLMLWKAYKNRSTTLTVYYMKKINGVKMNGRIYQTLKIERTKHIKEYLKGRSSSLRGRTYEEIHGRDKAALLKEKKRQTFARRIFSDETKEKMKTNHANVLGKNNPRSISGVLFDSSKTPVFRFSHLNELKVYCENIGLPFRGLKSSKWNYDPVITNRNLKYKKFVGYHCKFD